MSKKIQVVKTQNQPIPVDDRPSSLLPDGETLRTVERLAKYILDSGEYSNRFKNEAQAIMVILRGHNLGITFDAAIDHVFCIHGKTGISGQLMLRLIYERVPSAVIDFEETENPQEIASVTMSRDGKAPRTFSFSIKEAEAAGLTKNPVWRAYREDMLRWRAVSRGARLIFPDAIQGCWLSDELRGSSIKKEDLPTNYRSSGKPEGASVSPEPEPDAHESCRNYTREQMRDLLQRYNERYQTKHSYKTAALELIGLILEDGQKFTQEEVNALCDIMSGALEPGED